jgi:serine/threonine protein kinase
MDPSRGDTLEQRLREPGLPFRASATRVLQVLTGVLAGLRHLHQHGWVLRDLTPRNILIERRSATWNAPSTEVAYIIDFGLARRLPAPNKGYVDPSDAKVLLNGPLMV